MHPSPSSSLLVFLVLLLLSLISPSATSPITELVAASQSISIPPVHNGTLVPPSGALTSVKLTPRQQKDWTLNIYWQSQEDGSYVPMSICDTNYEDGNMCSVGYFTSKYLSSVSIFSPQIPPIPQAPFSCSARPISLPPTNKATIWIWDNTCKQIGYSNPVSYANLASGNVYIPSWLPVDLQIQVLGNPQDGHSQGFNVNFWYHAAPLWGWFDLLAVDPFPCCRLGDEDHEFFSMVLPFQCH